MEYIPLHQQSRGHGRRSSSVYIPLPATTYRSLRRPSRSRQLAILATLFIVGLFLSAHTLGSLPLPSFGLFSSAVPGPHPNCDYAYTPLPQENVSLAPQASPPSTLAYFPLTLHDAFYHLFVPQPARAADVCLQPYPPSAIVHHVFDHASSQPVARTRDIPLDCLDRWFTDGRWSCEVGMLLTKPRIDFVWTWVNGSDPLHELARSRFQPGSNGTQPGSDTDPLDDWPYDDYENEDDGDEEEDDDDELDAEERERIAKAKAAGKRLKQYRDHGELAYSLRSVRAATARWPHPSPSALNRSVEGGSRWHIVTNSYAIPAREADAWAEMAASACDPDVDELYDDDDEYMLARRTMCGRPEGGIMSKEEIARELRARRLGQVPQWLSFAELNAAAPDREVVLHHDTDLFRPFPPTEFRELSQQEIDDWRAEVLPTFDSMAVESQLANLPPDLVSPNTVFLMDDAFVMTQLPPTEFYSPLHGPVLRFHPSFSVTPLSPSDPLPPGSGEWRGLRTAATHLSERFGHRSRPYIEHNARAIPLPLLHEAAAAFPDVWTDTARARFRGQSAERPESHALWLASAFVVERHREALLWSWIVAKHGGRRGILSATKKLAMWAELDGRPDIPEVRVPWSPRSSRRRVDEELKLTGQERLERSEYVHVSQDGYPWMYWPRWDFEPELPSTRMWTDLAQDDMFDPPRTVCSMERLSCFGDEDEPAWSVFARVVNDRRECGDCIIAALTRVSGHEGQSAFLPPPSPSPITSPNADAHSDGQPAHLPFALSQFASFPLPPDPRAFVIRLLHRYQYVLGASPTDFFGIHDVHEVQDRLADVDHKAKSRATELTFLCINDDLGDADEAVLKNVDGILRNWWERRWGTRLRLELG